MDQYITLVNTPLQNHLTTLLCPDISLLLAWYLSWRIPTLAALALLSSFSLAVALRLPLPLLHLPHFCLLEKAQLGLLSGKSHPYHCWLLSFKKSTRTLSFNSFLGSFTISLALSSALSYHLFPPLNYHLEGQASIMALWHIQLRSWLGLCHVSSAQFGSLPLYNPRWLLEF